MKDQTFEACLLPTTPYKAYSVTQSMLNTSLLIWSTFRAHQAVKVRWYRCYNADMLHIFNFMKELLSEMVD